MTKKIVLVTGGVEGMGLAICKKLISENYTVTTTYFPEQEDLARELSLKLPELELVSVDFSSSEGVVEFTKRVSNKKIDALVNNASFFDFESFANFDYSIWNKTFSINLIAPLILVHELKNALQDGSAIVNMSTTDAFVGAFASSAWAASKSALISLTKSLANNFGTRNIRVNAIAAGWIGNVSDLGEAGIMAESVNITPLRRMGTVEEIADVVFFLLSSNASFVNGATIVVDGGYTGVDLIGKKEAESL